MSKRKPYKRELPTEFIAGLNIPQTDVVTENKS